MSALERNAYPVPGPKFERVDGDVLFSFVIDSSNIIGPRPVTEADKAEHVGAWMQFKAADDFAEPAQEDPPEVVAPVPEVSAPIGFPPKEEASHERDALRKDLTMLGVEVDLRWGVPRLKKELDKATKPEA